MNDKELNNKRVAKNTIILYLRTIVTLAISLFTSRAILNILGVQDYGIYNVVGGFVSMFSIISSTMISSTQRYLNFEFGKIENNKSTEVFNCSLVLHALLGLFLIIVFETFGLWFLNTRLNIPLDRMNAANWVFQFSILTFVLNVLRAPFDASIIAHERMKAFAYVNLFEAVLKLAIVYSLLLPVKIDNLIQYSVLMLLIAVIVFVIYSIYCIKNFEEIIFIFVKDRSLYRNIIGFASYNFVGASSIVFAQQGVNILLNVFFGVAVNAARGITDQVQAAISKFVGDFTTALNPQITKSYAQQNIANMMNLIIKGTRIAFFLFLFFSLPILLYTEEILSIWLGIIPDYAVFFVKLALIDALINTLAGPISTGILATGIIKGLSLWLGCIRFSIFPLSYLFFKIGMPPYVSYIILIVIDIVLIYVRLFFASKTIGVSTIPFLKDLFLRVIPVALFAGIVGYLIMIFTRNHSALILLIGLCLVCVSTLFFVVFVGASKSERKMVLDYILKKKNE